ncbi:MAG TPA: helix-turn-helix transcriptional regulator [Spirochaetales bacterium]|nr:helix-turn-helix transcriptional regulator [Spirochaetales bacterium]HPM72884.1 helix-turn-helix transcriptional regulator [Spirochaetales bacterium]
MILSEPSAPTADDLREREKELDFFYSLAALLSKPGLDADEAAAGCARLFAAAMGRPEAARVVVRLGDRTATYAGEGAPSDSPDSSDSHDSDGPSPDAMAALAGSRLACGVEASYPGGEQAFSERERSLCSSTAALLAVAAERLEADERERLGRSELERKNAALSELLSRIELEKAGIRSAMRSAFEERVSPLVAGLAGVAAASGRREEAARLEARIRRELDVMLSRGAPLADDPRMRLSVRELEVCDLVASGLSSKEIAELLSIAASTVERHRHNARRKLGMPAREGSLSTAIARNDRDL